MSSCIGLGVLVNYKILKSLKSVSHNCPKSEIVTEITAEIAAEIAAKIVAEIAAEISDPLLP
jgi:hypothetical protein